MIVLNNIIFLYQINTNFNKNIHDMKNVKTINTNLICGYNQYWTLSNITIDIFDSRKNIG